MTTYKTIQFRLTWRCNFSCPWCSQPETVNPTVYDLDLYKKRAFEIIDSTDSVNAYALMGGEPMVEMDLCKSLVSRIRSKDNDATIAMITNGSFMTDEHFDWFVENNVKANLSTSGLIEGEKGLDILLSPDMRRYLDAGIVFCIALVIDPFDTNFSDKIINLIRLFETELTLPFDQWKMKQIDELALENIDHNYAKVKQFLDDHYPDHNPTEFVTLAPFWSIDCTAGCLTLHQDSTVTTCTRDLNDPSEENLRCRVVTRALDPKIYKGIVEIIKKHGFYMETVK